MQCGPVLGVDGVGHGGAQDDHQVHEEFLGGSDRGREGGIDTRMELTIPLTHRRRRLGDTHLEGVPVSGLHGGKDSGKVVILHQCQETNEVHHVQLLW